MYRFGCKRTAFCASQVAKVSLSYLTNAMKPPPAPSLHQKRRTTTRGSDGKKTLKTASTLDPAAKDYLSTTESISIMADSLQQVSLATDSSPLPSIPLRPLPVHISTPPAISPATAFTSKKQIKNQPNVKSKRDAAGRQPKVRPSKASGGIPNPSPEYLMLSKAVSYPLHDPQDLLVIIDLNGTLLYRPNKKQPTKFLSRPHASLFLKYCIDTFRVVIWSSARPENVAAMCNSILTPEMRRKVVAIWGRDKFNLTRGDFDLRVQCYKRLTSIWQDPQIASSHPHYLLGGKWDQTNTVLVDDSLDKGRSEPFNLIEVPEWTGDMQDGTLPQVHDHLNHLSLHSNVSGCHYARPFKPRV